MPFKRKKMVQSLSFFDVVKRGIRSMFKRK